MSGEAVRRCLIVGEVGQAHDGSLGLAHAFIDAIAEAGADAVKFQTHIAEAESTPSEPWRVRFSRQDPSRYAYWQRMEFSEEQWTGLKRHAGERGLKFISSPFSTEAVEMLVRVGIDAWKVASGEAGNTLLLERMARLHRPVLLSTGMSPLTEIDSAVAAIRRADLPCVVLQCTSIYPCPPEKVGLNMLEVFRQRYENAGVGISDHSGTIFPGLAATALGIDVLEVHVTLSRHMFGPDVPASLTPEELRLLADGVRFIERLRAHPVDKDALAEELQPMRGMFTKSLVARQDLAAGTILWDHHLAMKKPGTGIPAGRLPEVVGRRLRRPLRMNQLLSEDDLEPDGQK